MSILSGFRPTPTLTDQDIRRGLRRMTMEGVSSMGYGSIATSGFLAGYALILGANNLQIGILAALPFLAQPLQIPAIVLVERLRHRKAIATATWVTAQAIWIPTALIPLIAEVPSGAAIGLLLGLTAVRSLLTAVTNCAWSSWVRDLVPQDVLGRFFARRLALANVMAMGFGLGAAGFVDIWRRMYETGPEAALGYAIPLLFGALTLGIASPIFMSSMPEPLMQLAPGRRPSLVASLLAPLKDSNYRHLVRFQFFWGLALNLATPFFAVYMLQRLGLPLSAVVAFSVLSQGANILFLRVWGPLADRLSTKAVLSVTSSLYMLVVFCWIFTTLPERYFLTIPLLIVLHIMAGVAAAGVTLTTGTIGLKLAPQGQATSYLAVTALGASLGSGLGPLLGGRFADFFSVRSLSMTFEWIDPTRTFQLAPLHLTGFDFLFGIAFVIGLFTINALTALREEGEVERGVVLEALMAPMRGLSAPASSVPGLALLGSFPYGYLRRAPIPGLDVAVGVTAYQIAEAARAAARAASHGRSMSLMVKNSLDTALSGARERGGLMSAEALEIARQAARGAAHAVGEGVQEAGEVARDATFGIMSAMSQAAMDPLSVPWGIAYGAVQGADESGADVAEAASQVVRAAGQAAKEEGMSVEVAEARAAEGALAAAEDISPEAADQVRQSLQKKRTRRRTRQT